MKKAIFMLLIISLCPFLMSNGGNAGQVMGVLGPVSGDKLGQTLVHEHMTFAYANHFADESVAPYNRDLVEDKCLKILKDVRSVGVKTIVDPSMCDVGGRDPILLKNLSEKSGINIIMATGLYWEGEGGARYYKWNQMVGRNIEEDIYELFKREITVGIGHSGVKAGVVKVASGDPQISEYERIVFKARVRAALETGVPILTHTQGGTVGPAQQELFLSLGANPKRIVIGHQNNSIDINYHLAQLKNPDFYLGFDRTSLGDVKAEDCIIELVKLGYANRILLSHDSIGVWLGRPFAWPTHLKMLENWYPTYIHQELIPKMKLAGVTDEQINIMMVENPRRLLTGEP